MPLLAGGLSPAYAQFDAVYEVAVLTADKGFALYGVAPGDATGSAVSGGRDLNGDGVDDLVIGAPLADTPDADAGKTYVVFGGTQLIQSGFDSILLGGLDGVSGFALTGLAAGDRSGSSVGFAGDINDDGTDDLVIGAPDASPGDAGAGSSYVLFGGVNVNDSFSTVFLSGILDGVHGFALSGAASADSSGSAVGFAGDVNADGKDDLVIGAPDASPQGDFSGISHVLFGNTDVNASFSTLFLSGLDSARGFALHGAAENDKSGFAVNFAGDINADGKDDLVIGAPGASPNGDASGSSYVLFGDVNINDSFDVLFLSGLDGVRGFGLSGVAAGDAAGSAVSTVGDLNNDGIDDLVIGAPNVDSNGTESGAVYVVFGAANVNQGFSNLFLSGLDGVRGFKINGANAGDHFGSAVGLAGDLNDDGISDLVIGAPDASPNGAASGTAYVLFGGANLNSGFSELFLSVINGNAGFKINGAEPGDRLGAAVSSAGDINNDGVDDLVIGAPGADSNGAESGNSYLILGRSNELFSDGFES